MRKIVGRTSIVTVFRKPNHNISCVTDKRVKWEDDQNHCVQETQTVKIGDADAVFKK
jgi:hypothetical protein